MRLIDADALDDVVQDLNENKNYGITRGEYKRIDAVLFEFPTIEPEDRCGECDAWNQYKNYPPRPQWIPCDERMPDGQTEVIVSCCDDAGDSRYDYTACGWMTRDGEYWIVDNEINYYVNAWMPLPKPWKGEE